MPCSEKDTLFSTPEDVKALDALLRIHPYPQHKTYIRQGHGFIVLAETVNEGVEILQSMIDRKVAGQAQGGRGERRKQKASGRGALF